MRFSLENILPYRIWHQIFLILIFLVVFPLIVLGLLLINTSQNAVKSAVLRDHKEIAVRASGEVREFLKGTREALRVTAALLGTLPKNDAWQHETSLVELVLRYSLFSRVSSLDLNGQELASSALGKPLKNREKEEFFLKAKKGEFYSSEVYTSSEYMPMITWAIPIKQLGRVSGVLVAEISLRGIWDIVDSIQIGETGRAYLVDSNGRIVAHPDKKLILKNKDFFPQEFVRDALSGQSGSQEEVVGQGEEWLVSYSPVEDMQWGLIVFQSPKEAFSFVRTMKGQSWVLIVVGIIAAGFISIGMSRLMSRPINKLIEGTQRIADSDFDNPLLVNRNDEMGQLIYSFNDMMARLNTARRAEKLSIIGKSATAIAHELKNSLVLVNTFIQLLPERYQDEEFVKEVARIVPRELNIWKGMLQEMMDYSRFDRFEKTPVDINDLVCDTVLSLKEMVRQHKVYFHVQIADPLPLVKGNEDKLRQVLINLLTNAFEVTPAGGAIMIDAGVSLEKDQSGKEYVFVKIKDTGKGLSSEDIDKIFEPFYTTKTNGLGLGLTISSEIIERHGGKIKIFSELHKGTVFVICLPVLSAVLRKDERMNVDFLKKEESR